MSDTRREIAERHARSLLTSAKPDFMIIESAMSEYAAAVLEEMANKLITRLDQPFVTNCVKDAADLLRARATQERER